MPAIIGGVNTTPAEHPWHVALVNPTQGKFSPCGGSLITDRHVLTAAHCVKGQTLRTLAVNIGPKTRTDTSRNGVIIAARRLYVHPRYDGNRIKNDVAIIELVKPVEGFGTKNVP